MQADSNLQVRCSGGDGSGDPENICGDEEPNNGECQQRPGTKPVQGTNKLEAYADPHAHHNTWTNYSRITFCNEFFLLNSLTDAISLGKKKPQVTQNNLETWNSRARCFLHETTHLDWFMDAPNTSPFVDDLSFQYKAKKKIENAQGYGPYNAKIIRNYAPTGKAGFYPQRNGV